MISSTSVLLSTVTTSTGDDHISQSHSSHITSEITTVASDKRTSARWTTDNDLIFSPIMTSVGDKVTQTSTAKPLVSTLYDVFTTRLDENTYTSDVTDLTSTYFFPTSDVTLNDDTMASDSSTLIYYSTTTMDLDMDNDTGHTRMLLIISGTVGGGLGLLLITITFCVTYKCIIPRFCRKRSPIVRNQHHYLDLDPLEMRNIDIMRSLGSLNEESAI